MRKQGEIKELVRSSVKEALNGLLETEAENLIQAARYEFSEKRKGWHWRQVLEKMLETVKTAVLKIRKSLILSQNG